MIPTKEGFMIREFQPDDMENCARLLVAAYNGEPWNCHWTLETATRYLLEFVACPNFVGFVLCGQNEVLGAMFAHRKAWWTNDELFVDELYIAPHAQRQGLGQQLLEHAEAYARTNGLAGLTLLTNRDMPAKSFYIKHGYTTADHVVFMYRQV